MRAIGCGLFMVGCAGLPQPISDDASGMRLARMTNLAGADPLNDETIHQVLFAAYSRSRDPMKGGEDLLMIHRNLLALRRRLGDERFAEALRREDRAVVAAVAWRLGPENPSADFPLTSEVLANAPKRRFELETAYSSP